jgi:hypothetical protein
MPFIPPRSSEPTLSSIEGAYRCWLWIAVESPSNEF